MSLGLPSDTHTHTGRGRRTDTRAGMRPCTNPASTYFAQRRTHTHTHTHARTHAHTHTHTHTSPTTAYFPADTHTHEEKYIGPVIAPGKGERERRGMVWVLPLPLPPPQLGNAPPPPQYSNPPWPFCISARTVYTTVGTIRLTSRVKCCKSY